MKPAEDITLEYVADALRGGLLPTETTASKDRAGVIIGRAQFRLINGRECFEWTARQIVQFRDVNTRAPLFQAVLFEASGALYWITVKIQRPVPITSVSAREYSDAWSDALHRFNAVLEQVVPRVVGTHAHLATRGIQGPPAFMRIAVQAGQSFPLPDGPDLKRVVLCRFDSVGPPVTLGSDGVFPGSSIAVSELVAERALSLDRWASILRGGVPAQGGVSKGDPDVVRFSRLRRTTAASVPVLTWTGTGSRYGVHTDVAGAVFSRKGHSYFVSAAQFNPRGPAKGKPAVECTALDMVRRILKRATR
jgi:hypothetical protein